MKWLDTGIAEGSPATLMLDIDVAYDRIRHDGRFAHQLARCGVR